MLSLQGFYYAHCTSPCLVHQLVTRQVVWGAGFYAHCMPWDPDFDPAQTYMSACPVWVTIKALPPFLAPLLPHIAATLESLVLPAFGFSAAHSGCSNMYYVDFGRISSLLLMSSARSLC